MLTAVDIGLVAGYALLGSGWLMLKTEAELHGDARRWAWRAAFATTGLLAAVSLATLFVHPRVAERWGFARGHFDLSVLIPLIPIPLLGGLGLATVGVGLVNGSHRLPFVGGLVVFASGYLGLAISFFPYVAPYALTFRQAASADNALALMLGGVVVMLPLILGYTFFVYRTFRGKVGDAGYH